MLSMGFDSLIFFLLIVGYIFQLFYSLENFDLMTDTFSLLSGRYICIPVNILELCSRMQLNYLENVRSF